MRREKEQLTWNLYKNKTKNKPIHVQNPAGILYVCAYIYCVQVWWAAADTETTTHLIKAQWILTKQTETRGSREIRAAVPKVNGPGWMLDEEKEHETGAKAHKQTLFCFAVGSCIYECVCASVYGWMSVQVNIWPLQNMWVLSQQGGTVCQQRAGWGNLSLQGKLWM